MRNFVRELVVTMVIAIVIFLLLRLTVGSYAVVSQAMEPGLQIGQRVLISKVAFQFRDPLRGEIIYYKSPDGDLDQLKRVIGLPGDLVEVSDGSVYVNGVQLDEPYIANPAGYTLLQYQVPRPVLCAGR
jgi:signal peptidase I